MKYTLGKLSVLFLSLFMAHFAVAQQVEENNQGEFGDFIYRKGNMFRSASGKPGPSYWQNEADYKIDVTLNDEDHSITGSISITYTNNSPEELDFVWLSLEQNRFTKESRGTLTTPIQGNRYNGDVDGGYKLSNINGKVGKKGDNSNRFVINDTRMQVFFAEPIPAKGGQATISMDFSYIIPVKGMDRMGRLDVEEGTIYALAQWYPRLAVFDDVKGWNVEPYLGAGEFYLEYGDFEYSVTAPAQHIVVGSGEFLNPGEVLSKEMQNRLNQAMKSDTAVQILKAEEVADPATRAKSDGTLTWKFKIENSRDVAFASSKAFIWDAAKVDLPSGKTIIAQSVYPKESDGQEAWARSTEYSKASIEHYSEMWFEFPYASATNVAADIGGMEYPGLNFCSFESKGEDLWGVTDHEFGHNWFPMIVGSNERLYPWMDEGFNTFINHYSTQAFNDGEYTADLDHTRKYLSWFNRETREGIETYPDVVNTSNLGMTAYMKPGIGLIMLREYILDHARFDNAFKSYIKTWAYKHPQPTDFFNHMENVAGENLNWFWQNWFYGTENIDLSIDAVYPYGGNYVLALSNRGGVPMPVLLEVIFEDGSSERVKLPVEIWQRGNQWNHLFQSDKVVKSIEIDPDKILPDVNIGNDKWPAAIYDKD